MNLNDFDYYLPKELIAQEPSAPRSASRLLVAEKNLISKALNKHNGKRKNAAKDLGISDELINLKGLTPGMLLTLGEQKILNLEDFADLASDELTGGFDVVKGEKIKIQGYLEDFALSKSEADELIMSARNIVYKY